MSKAHDELLDHDYDGIKEYDNPLPRWWLYLLYGSIVYAFAYVPYYHWGPGPLQIEEFETEMAEAAANAPKAVAATGDSMDAAIKDPARLKEGEGIYVASCQACHAPGGAGLVGPNLTDKFWLHGGSMTDLVKVITDGVPEKGMIAWNKQLSPKQIVSVSAYLQSLKGTKPANPKAAQGDAHED